MKEIERRKKVRVIETEVEYNQSLSYGEKVYGGRSKYITTTLQSDNLLTSNGYVEVIVKESVPETLIEFREIHGISKLELIDWLNDHYQYID